MDSQIQMYQGRFLGSLSERGEAKMSKRQFEMESAERKRSCEAHRPNSSLWSKLKLAEYLLD